MYSDYIYKTSKNWLCTAIKSRQRKKKCYVNVREVAVERMNGKKKKKGKKNA